MKIALLGASGRVGQRITLETLVRGHEVKALVRNPESFPIPSVQLNRPSHAHPFSRSFTDVSCPLQCQVFALKILYVMHLG